MANESIYRSRPNHQQIDQTKITRTNFFAFATRCQACPDDPICDHTRSITIEPKLKKEERRPRFKCLVCQIVPTSAKLLVKHLHEDHNILTKFRCAECKKSNFKSFRSVTAHQQHCANPLPDPISKEPPFVPSNSRPQLGTGILDDILALDDEPFRVIAAKVLFRTATIDQLYYEFVRIIGKPRRSPKPRVATTQDQVQVSPDSDQLWSKDRKRMWNTLIKGNINPELDIDEAYEYFNSSFGVRSISRLVPIQVHQAESISIGEYIDNNDILFHLDNKRDSSPGLDNIGAIDLYPHLLELRVMVNLCLWVKDIPEAWRKSVTSLIPKKSSTNPADYRPISVGLMAYRVLTAILARRLQGRLEPHQCQKGFLPQDGTHEAITVCRYLSHQSVTIASIDVAKAFDTVSQDAILAICAANGLSRSDLILLKNMYRDCQTCLKVNGVQSQKIWIRRGVKQGDPLSPILFNLVVDQLLRRLEKSGYGIAIDGKLLCCLAYADDLLLFGRDVQEIEALAQLAVEYYSEVGLAINAKKTTLTGTIEPATINGEIITPVLSFRYLGTIIDPTNANRYKSTDICFKLHRIATSDLSPGQKLYFIRQHLIPELLHRLIHENSLSSTLYDIDGRIRKTVKRILGLPNSTPTSFFYLSLNKGGLGLTQLRYDVPRIAVKRLVRLANSNSWFVRAITKTKWFASEIKRVNQLCPTNNDNQFRLMNDIRKFQDGHVNFQIGGSLVNRHISGTSRLRGDKFMKLVQLRAGMMIDHEEWCSRCNKPKTMQHLLNECVLTKTAQGPVTSCDSQQDPPLSRITPSTIPLQLGCLSRGAYIFCR